MDEFDLDLDEVSEVNTIYQADPRSKDRRICICGHAMSRHHFNEYQNKHFCKPGQLACPCYTPRAVLEVPNTRYFMRKSLGSGAMHALSRGVAASIEALGQEEWDSRRKWLVEAKCDGCQKETKYYPARVKANGEPLPNGEDVPGQGANAFLCEVCRNR